jgi:hypothetical protein
VLDGYGSRFAYGVTENMITQKTFSPDGGAIDITDNNTPPVSVISPAATADFVLISYGPDQSGANLRNGQSL